jgi:CRP-like cAMP-binding protein
MMNLLNDIDNHVNEMKINLSKQVAAERSKRASMQAMRRASIQKKADTAEAERLAQMAESPIPGAPPGFNRNRRRMSITEEDIAKGEASGRVRRVSIGMIAKPQFSPEVSPRTLSDDPKKTAANAKAAATVSPKAKAYLAPKRDAKIVPDSGSEGPETDTSPGSISTAPTPSKNPKSPKSMGPPLKGPPAASPVSVRVEAGEKAPGGPPAMTPKGGDHKMPGLTPIKGPALSGPSVTSATKVPEMKGPRMSMMPGSKRGGKSPSPVRRWMGSPGSAKRSASPGNKTGDNAIGRTLHKTLDTDALKGALKDKEEQEEERRQLMAREAFKLIDVNGDGFLQKDEVLQALKNMNKQGVSLVPATMEAVDKMMGEIDADGDGQIDMDEFVEMMKNAPKLGQRGTLDGGGGLGNALGGGRMSVLARNVLLAHERHKEMENTIGHSRLIHPHDWKHASWDVLMSVLIMVTVVTMPLSLGWECVNEKLFILNSVVDGLFLCDVVKNFNTGYIDENESIVMDRKRVYSNYLFGYFMIDLLSSFPIDPALDAAGIGGGGSGECLDTLEAMLNSEATSTSGASELTKATKGLKMLKLLRMAKLFRLLRLSRVFRYIKMGVIWAEEKLHVRISDGFTKLIKLGIGVLLICHWIGSFNFMVCRMYEFPPDSWAVQTGIENESASTQWTWSFFKAMSMMIMIGFDTPSFTNVGCMERTQWCAIEHWMTLLCLYIGAIFYSLLISSVANILNSSNISNRIFEEKLGQLDDYMRSQKLPAALREKVKDHFHLQHSDGKLFDEDEILGGVTPILRREIVAFKHREVLHKVPLLQNTEENEVFALEVATMLNVDIIFMDEVVVRENMSGSDIFFIFSGVIEIYLESAADLTYVAIGDGCYFGEVSVLLGCKRTASARTKTQCVLYRITAQNLKHLLVDYPDKQEYMLRVAKARQKRIIHYLGMDKSKLSREDEQDEEDAKTELFGVDADEMMMQKDVEFEQSRAHARISLKQAHHNNHTPASRARISEVTGGEQRTSLQVFQSRPDVASLVERANRKSKKDFALPPGLPGM